MGQAKDRVGLTRCREDAKSAVLLTDAGVPKAKREDDDLHWVVTAVGVVGAAAVAEVSDWSVVRERIRCEMRSERGMGHVSETAVASVTT